LFEKWPTAQALSEANEELESLLAPHGFQRVKAKRLRRMSSDFLQWDGKNPQQLYGIGKYASDADRIFYGGERPHPSSINDGALRSFLERGDDLYIPADRIDEIFNFIPPRRNEDG